MKCPKSIGKSQEFKKLLDHANSLDNLLEQQFDCVYLAGGHGAMYDFPDNEALKTIVRKQDESGRIVGHLPRGQWVVECQTIQWRIYD